MGRRVTAITHLLFTYDMLIFSNGRLRSLQNLMELLKMYELSSGQQINLQKSSYFASKHICSRRRLRIQHVPGCQARAFPITYLGAPLFKDRAKQSYFEEISNKTISKIEGWYNQYLSFAGKITLIKSVLSSIPIHILSCMVVPKAIILKVDSLLKNLLWANK